MPAERTQKSLKQSTLFNFAKPVAAASTAPKRSPANLKPPHHDYGSDHGPDADNADATVDNTPPPSPKSRETPSKSKPEPKPKAKPKAKAGHDDRSLEHVILCIKPEFTKLISERKKNYEYRKYKLKENVKHLWLYETAPTSAVTYVCLSTHPSKDAAAICGSPAPFAISFPHQSFIVCAKVA